MGVFLRSVTTLRACVWARHEATVAVRGDEASLKHRLDGLLVLLVGLLSSLDLLEFEVEAVDGLELVLDGLLLGEGGGLLVLDFLLGPSSNTCGLHPTHDKRG